jgi:hypothetical protein
MVFKWLKISKSLFTFTKKKKIDSQNWFMGVATWRNLHNTTKPVILTALVNLRIFSLPLPVKMLPVTGKLKGF